MHLCTYFYLRILCFSSCSFQAPDQPAKSFATVWVLYSLSFGLLLFPHKVEDHVHCLKTLLIGGLPTPLIFRTTPQWGCFLLPPIHWVNPFVNHTSCISFFVNWSQGTHPCGSGISLGRKTGVGWCGSLATCLCNYLAFWTCSCQIYHIHFTVDYCWAYLSLRLCGSDRIQFTMGYSGCRVTCFFIVRY